MRSKTAVALRKYGLCQRPLLKGKQSSLTHKHHSLSKSWEQQSTECKGTIWNRLETMLTISQVCFLNEIQLVEAWYLHQEFLSSVSEAFLVIHREKHCTSFAMWFHYLLQKGWMLVSWTPSSVEYTEYSHYWKEIFQSLCMLCFSLASPSPYVHPTLLCLPKGHKCNVEETILYTQQYVIHKYDMASNEVIAWDGGNSMRWTNK